MKPFTLGLKIGRLFRDDPSLVFRVLNGTQIPDEAVPEEDLRETGNLPQNEPFRSIAEAVVDGDVQRAEKLSAEAVKSGIDPLDIALGGLLKGMDRISDLYNQRRIFVPEVLLAARALEAGLSGSGGSKESFGKKGSVLLHTAEGDLHDIGKNIIGAIVEANGYRVIDLGPSVETATIIEGIRKHHPVAVIGSSLMTSTRGAFIKTAEEMKRNGIDIPLIVGGGACDDGFIRGWDGMRYARDPSALVALLDSMR